MKYTDQELALMASRFEFLSWSGDPRCHLLIARMSFLLNESEGHIAYQIRLLQWGRSWHQ